MLSTKRERMSGLVLAFLGALFFFSAPIANAAELSLSPSTAEFPMGGEFSLKVSIDPKGQSVNASDGTVNFDKDVLSVVNVSKDGSVFSLWTAEPAFSNGNGTVTFSGGTPSAFSNKGTIVTIRFKPKKVGTAKLTFSNGSVLAADGKGTNVFSAGQEATITIVEGTKSAPVEAAPAESESVISGGATPLAPTTLSPTHAKPDLWYGTSTAQFTWKAPGDVTSVRWVLSDKEDAKPTEVHKDASLPLFVRDIKDGVSFLVAQYRNEYGWGEVGTFKLQIDTVPPKEFDFSLVESADGTSPPRFAFEVTDELSGIEKYEILFGSTAAVTIKAADFLNGSTPVPPQSGGPTIVSIKAYDKAGNVREVKKEMTLPVVVKANAKAAVEEVEKPPVWTSERIVLLLFAFIIGGLTTWIFYTRSLAFTEKDRLLHRVAEIADRNDRVFTAMREEFEQMINDFDEKPQLTPKEREMVEHVKEVLDISEELVTGDLSDLKKMVRGQ